MPNETVNAIKETAGVIPVVGGIFSSVAALAGQLGLKGKTTHLSWGEADNLAQPFSEQMTNSLQSKYDLNDETTKKLWQNFQKYMTAFITSDEQGSTWWTDQTRKSYWQWFTYDVEQSTQRESLRHCFWLQAHWIYENVDGTKLETEGAEKMEYVTNRVLVPAMLDSGIISSVSEVTVIKSGALPVASSGLQLNTAGLSDSKTLFLVGGIVLIIAVIYHTSKGG